MTPFTEEHREGLEIFLSYVGGLTDNLDLLVNSEEYVDKFLATLT